LRKLNDEKEEESFFFTLSAQTEKGSANGLDSMEKETKCGRVPANKGKLLREFLRK
jgi:hypothetical protein